jgi:hypothetical protein
MLPETDSGEAAVALERLRATVSKRLASGLVPVTCSLEAAAFPTAPERMEEMILAADSHMYLAAAGKNPSPRDRGQRERLIAGSSLGQKRWGGADPSGPDRPRRALGTQAGSVVLWVSRRALSMVGKCARRSAGASRAATRNPGWPLTR